ncbi:MAG: alpha-amylase [Candidatus Zambryskibacteria bacterium RIFCSPHIGHO2_12_FULL_38_34]|uniref:Alpha-amylase n=1 Tax=Candidatus Zambryskibacteria bacterium RIFCSPLOWO2_12_FULL_39_16 TaxID=1802775 RepID=A0A1G2UQX9_9BACT|nr:MAG: alpha-amylase [Candidatus Zambryskibacteria bacterium RIFCSPHIGHO2_12_FULL_38_34]OHB08244.1 MAG: alpha-amylase [Candidatus Zambryskibacteria bacterium RIFCSPLOWO2_02_FULL_38_13]OHB11786.1 MAG: alpha-amylase [Candidatus Zambryskibacteria bacterium RIFCSPLOWO2_12_FULL_39_16]
MPSVCFYFQVHQPLRVRKYRIFDVGQNSSYFNDESGTSLDNRAIIKKVAGKCYLPANAVLLQNIKNNPEFKASFSISGLALEQFEKHAPEVIDSFKVLVDTGNVELLSETYYHSLASIYSEEEFINQVLLHRKKVQDLFGVIPSVFRNTELIYSNQIAKMAEKMGYRGILAEGADHILGWRSPTFVYKPIGTEKIKLLLKHYRLSDDIAFRFSQRSWEGWPLTAPKFADWVSSHNGNANTINLFMDYETFGEHQWEDTGIFEFLKYLPAEILKNPDNNFITPSEAIDRYEAKGELDVPHHVSWADTERDLSAWISNDLQREALDTLYALGKEIIHVDDPILIEDWRKLQTSDHFYYMCTKWWNDGDVHKYFSPYESPYEAFIAYMNVMQDMRLRLSDAKKRQEHEVFLHKVKPLRFSEV